MDLETVTLLYQGEQLRTIVLDNEPWFVAKDVCKILKGVRGD